MPAEIARAGLPGSPRTSQRPPETAAKSERSDPGVFEGVAPSIKTWGYEKGTAMMPERSNPGGFEGVRPLIKDFGVTKKGGKNAAIFRGPWGT